MANTLDLSLPESGGLRFFDAPEGFVWNEPVVVVQGTAQPGVTTLRAQSPELLRQAWPDPDHYPLLIPSPCGQWVRRLAGPGDLPAQDLACPCGTPDCWLVQFGEIQRG